MDLAGLGSGRYNLRVQVDPPQTFGVERDRPSRRRRHDQVSIGHHDDRTFESMTCPMRLLSAPTASAARPATIRSITRRSRASARRSCARCAARSAPAAGRCGSSSAATRASRATGSSASSARGVHSAGRGDHDAPASSRRRRSPTSRARWASTPGSSSRASHNPFEDNGIKVFSGRGEKFTETLERDVEAIIARHELAACPGRPMPPVERTDVIDAYIAHTRLALPEPQRLGALQARDRHGQRRDDDRRAAAVPRAGLRRRRSSARRRTGATSTSTAARPTPSALARAGARAAAAAWASPSTATATARSSSTPTGRVVDGDAVLLMCARHMKAQGRLNGNALVATVMSNIGLEIALRDSGIELVRCPVGDKYVMEEMIKRDLSIGGEQSGHIIFSDHLFTGDGIATALNVLRVMAETGRELADLASELVTYPQVLVNVRVREKQELAIGAGDRRGDGPRRGAASPGEGRLLVRYSGTEPLLRVMIEGKDQQEIQGWARGDRRRGQRASRMSATGRATRLSVNVNKVATLRNSRGGARAVASSRRSRVCVDGRRAGHHRPSARRRAPHHAGRRARDRRVARAAARATSSSTSKGIPGPICSRWCCEVRPDQCTLVPVTPGEITSQAGWPADTPRGGAVGDRAAAAGGAASASACSSIPRRRRSMGGGAGRRSRRALHRAVRARVRRGTRGGERQLRALRRGRATAATRSASASTPATISISTTCPVPHAAAPRRSVDRPRAHQPRAVRRARPRGPGLPCGRGRSADPMPREPAAGMWSFSLRLVAAAVLAAAGHRHRPRRSGSRSGPRTACRSRRRGTSRA